MYELDTNDAGMLVRPKMPYEKGLTHNRQLIMIAEQWDQLSQSYVDACNLCERLSEEIKRLKDKIDADT